MTIGCFFSNSSSLSPVVNLGGEAGFLDDDDDDLDLAFFPAEAD